MTDEKTRQEVLDKMFRGERCWLDKTLRRAESAANEAAASSDPAAQDVEHARLQEAFACALAIKYVGQAVALLHSHATYGGDKWQDVAAAIAFAKDMVWSDLGRGDEQV